MDMGEICSSHRPEIIEDDDIIECRLITCPIGLLSGEDRSHDRSEIKGLG